MSMRPFFPSLRPSVTNGFVVDMDFPCDDEAELRELEKEHNEYVWDVSQIGCDLQPVGKTQLLAGPDTDDEDNNDESDDSDSRDNDEDDDDMDGNIQLMNTTGGGAGIGPANVNVGPVGHTGANNASMGERMDQ